MDQLEENLEKFRIWVEANKDSEPFYYPGFDVLCLECKHRINQRMCNGEMAAFLSCMALDHEEEIILDWCKELADLDFIRQIAEAAICHPERDARWQVVELLRERKVPGGVGYLRILSQDTDAYVRRRAENALEGMK